MKRLYVLLLTFFTIMTLVGCSEEVPENSTAVGIPAKIVRREGIRVDDLDQIHIPDPVAQEIARLEARLCELSEQLEKIKDQPSKK